MKNYRVTLKHDDGTVDILVRAESMTDARRIVAESERCPDRAIVSVWVIPTKRQIAKTKNLLRGI